jgi:hypothetical protein
MAHYLVTFQESDGNDCTVYDAVVEADNEDAAYGRVCDAIEAQMKRDGTPYEDDGDFGFYFDCGGECEGECDGHGGIVMREAVAYATLEEAEAGRSRYHVPYYV